jgi:chromosome partitioning protein
LRLIPSTENLAAAELELADVPGRERLLAGVLADVRGADVALIDCGPSLGLLSVLALGAARGVLVPVLAEYLAVTAVGRLVQTIERIRAGINPRLALAGVVICRYDERRILNREAAEDLRRHFGDKVYRSMIRENITIAEAPSYGKTVAEYRPASHGAEDFAALTREFMRRQL